MTLPAAAVPQRPIIAVYHHVRRSYHPLKQQGKWTAAEDATLKQQVTFIETFPLLMYIP